jgi:hypothetical protein
MSSTIQTAMIFPIVFSGICMLIAGGPILYEQSATASYASILSYDASAENHEIYSEQLVSAGDYSADVIATSPEKMHSFICVIQDLATCIYEGVTSS